MTDTILPSDVVRCAGRYEKAPDDKTRETLSDFNTRMLAVMGGARDMLAAADKATKADPVLVAHEAREGKS